MSEYYAILTGDGITEILESISEAREFDAATIAVGDSNGSYYEPTKDQTALKNLKYQAAPFKKGKRDNYLYFDLQIPASEGDYTIREAGVFSSDGKLLVAAKYPESKKTAADSASEKVLNIEIQVQVSDTIINTITIEESGNLATAAELENKANADLSNLTATGLSQYNVFCINTGSTDDNGEPSFLTYTSETTTDEETEVETTTSTLTTQGTFSCTLANGAIYEVTNTLTLDVSDYEDGTYNIFIDPVNLEIVALANSIYIDVAMPDDAADGDILLNVSKVPYSLQMQGSDNEPTYAYAGTLVITGGGGSLMSNSYNADVLALDKIGEPEISLTGRLSYGEIWLNGAEVSKTTYSTLYSVYGDTYGTPEDEDNFILPDFRDRAVWGADDFGYLDAGLPNATGALSGETSGGNPFWANAGSKALYNNNSSKVTFESYSTNSSTVERSSDSYVRLDLSRSNSIYGNSSTVQPPAIKVRVKTKYKI